MYLAHDARLGRGVAVKTLRADLAHDPELQARFRREAQSTASLNHPAIAAVYDTGEDDSMTWAGMHAGAGTPLPYLVMEYVEGATLREILHSGPPLTVPRALETAAGVLRALAHSHQHGIVHRDIKPANVMVTNAGQVKVMDFGIARDVRDIGMTQTAVVLGTAQYLSPEQARGEDVDARSDVYSAGCLLYELLTRRTPFTGESPVAVMYQHIQEAPQPPSLFNPEVGAQVDAIVLRALQKDPADRYQSAEEMLADVEACLGGEALTRGMEFEPEEAAASHTDDDEAEYGRSRGNAALITAGVVVAVMALAIGWFLFGRDAPSDGRADVPHLVGQTVDDARRAAENVGLTLAVEKSEPCADQPAGHICTQSPQDGELAQGATVSVTVSTGAPKVEVPDVTEKNETDASRILQDKGFEVTVRHRESKEDAGTVLEQSPSGGEQREKGTEVTLTVAKEEDKAAVPDLVGKTLSEARSLLAARDLKLGSTTEVESRAETGTVTGQSIAAGEEVAPGSSVDVQVAKAKETVQIPTDIIGRMLGDVEDELAGLGLQTSVASGYPRTSGALVTSSSPRAGADAEVGSTVIIVTEQPGDEPSGDATEGDGDTSASPSPSGS